MKQTKVVCRLCKYILIAILLIFLVLNLLSIYRMTVMKQQISMVFGYGNAVILTGSMEPDIKPGDMILIRKQGDYEIDDIVTYRGNTMSVTHRIIEETEKGYVTKGDANNGDDGEIFFDRIFGKVVLIIPKLGHVLLFFRQPLGIAVLFIGLLAIDRLPEFFMKKAERHKTTVPSNEDQA